MASGSWQAARLWARTEVRSRWLAFIALGLIGGITAGLALAAAAGAHDTSTALERLRQRTNASDDIVFASQVQVSHPSWAKLAHRPEVTDLAVWGLVFGDLDGDPEGLFMAPIGPGWLSTIDAPVMREGRMFDPASDDEVVIADRAAQQLHIRVGDTFHFRGYTVAENESARGATDVDSSRRAPTLTVHVVGIMRSPLEPLFVTDGFAVVSPGLLKRHPEIDFHENAVVQLRDPIKDVARLQAHASSDVAKGAPLLDLHAVSRRVNATTNVEELALGLLAAAIALAGLVLAGQVVSRSASRVGQDARVLRAIGLRRGAIAGASTLAHLPAAAVMAVTSVATALVASRWLPLGEAGRLVPDPGVHLDAWIVLPGTILAVALLIAASHATAWLLVGRQGDASVDQRAGLADWLRRHASPSVGIGTTLALRRGRGSTGLPVRPALLGAVVGVLGVASALTIDAGLHDALAHPERAGVAWEGQAVPQTLRGYTERGFTSSYLHEVTSVPEVTDIAQVDRASIPVDDGAGIPTFAVRAVDGSTHIALVTLTGHAPRRGEVVLGPATATALKVHAGDTITLGQPGRRLRVVGTGLFPSDVHSEFDEGIWADRADFDAVSDPENGDRLLALRFRRGTADRALHQIEKATASFDGLVGPVEQPPELTNLRGVLALPRLLAGFLALLALAALLHVLVSTTRLRSREFAVLRAIGFTRRSRRGVIEAQATTVFAVGLVLGIPLGVALGRVGWTLIARGVPLEVVAPLAAVATGLLVPVTLAVAQLVAFGPGRQVNRRSAALRVE